MPRKLRGFFCDKNYKKMLLQQEIRNRKKYSGLFTAVPAACSYCVCLHRHKNNNSISSFDFTGGEDDLYKRPWHVQT